MNRKQKLFWSGGALGFLLALLYSATFWIPLPGELLSPCPASTRLLDVHGNTVAILGNAAARVQEPVSLDAMSDWLPKITLALEDRRFQEHHGVDFRATLSALEHLFTGQPGVRGASTISQQLIKLARHKTQRGLLDKLYENLTAVRLERQWNKERILQEYLNRCDYGNRRLGPEAAAQAYFGKAASALTLPEAVFLAGLPKSPTYANPWLRPSAAFARYQISLKSLLKQGVLNDEQQARYSQEPPQIEQHFPPRLAPHFVDAFSQANPDLQGAQNCSLDLDLQLLSEQMLKLHLEQLAPFCAAQGAVVILDNKTGQIRALVGSGNYSGPDGKINGALQYRSCGSTLKPFLYSLAFDAKIITAATLLPDTPDAIRTEYGDYDPVNFDKRFWGPVRAREALACSLNVPAVYTLSQLGARNAFNGLRRCGLQFSGRFEQYGAGLILGNANIRLLDLATAFSAFSREGKLRAYTYLNECTPERPGIISPATAAIVTDILSDNAARSRCFGLRSPLAFDTRIPCKTGTSSGFRDAWTVGCTAEHTVAVWVGNFDGKPMNDLASVRAAAPLWRLLIDQLLKSDHPVSPPSENLPLQRAEICSLTGLLPTADSPRRIAELFLPGTVPTNSAATFLHRSASGKLCVELPPSYATWCASPFNYLSATLQKSDSPKILNPAPGAVYTVSRDLPLDRQKIPLVGLFPEGATPHWSINGVEVLPSASGQFFWPISSGQYIVEMRCNGATTQQRFTVE